MRVRIFPRTLRFKEPAETSRGIYYDRRVWYILLAYERQGRTALGIGECAPLPDLSADYDEGYEDRLRSFAVRFEDEGGINTELLRPYPSMLFGFETAILSAAASLRGDFLRLFDTPFTRGEAGIPINGLVWMGRYDEMLRRMEEKLAAGFRCIKFKIGAIRFEKELELLRRVRQRFPKEEVEIRVDANGAFCPEDALRRLEALAPYGLHSIEQPIRQGQWKEMARVCRESPVPIALDEELIGVLRREEKAALLDTIRPAHIVLKPSLHGGMAGAEEWIQEAVARNIGYWVTSALESNVGLNAIAAWASSFPSPLHQGLGTGALFVENFNATHLQIRGEQLWVDTEEELDFRRTLADFRHEWEADTPTINVRTSGSTGTPRLMQAEKERMRASASATCQALGLQAGDTALLCLPLDYIAGKMMAVRAFTLPLRLTAVCPTSRPLRRLRHSPTFAALTPMQAWESLQYPRERRLLRGIRKLILGGGSIPPALADALRTFPHEVWSTYGMTETLSHIALRRLNGPQATELYTPLPGVGLRLTPGGTLAITAPAICPDEVVTNDLAELHADGRFRIIGRQDNVVCSGGLKFQIEELEERLRPLTVPFALSTIPDARLGECLVLLHEGGDAEQIRACCVERLTRHEQPRAYYRVDAIPLTETGKIARRKLREMALKAYRNT
ncbi:MAG: AMP-binding protein [Alloprevotella sp.]|nr:AMP-binding protein [Alloprevotella sp.]